MFKTTILVEPEPKGRPRSFINKRTGRIQVYTPSKTVKIESAIRAALVDKGCFFDKGIPLYLEVTFYLPRPVSTPKKVTMPTKKPDLDNYLKLLDSLQGYILANDSQITTILAKKRFGSPPRIELMLKEDLY